MEFRLFVFHLCDLIIYNIHDPTLLIDQLDISVHHNNTHIPYGGILIHHWQSMACVVEKQKDNEQKANK